MEKSVIPCLTFILFLIKRTKSELYIKRGISCVYKLFENGHMALNKRWTTSRDHVGIFFAD